MNRLKQKCEKRDKKVPRLNEEELKHEEKRRTTSYLDRINFYNKHGILPDWKKKNSKRKNKKMRIKDTKSTLKFWRQKLCSVKKMNWKKKRKEAEKLPN